MGAATERIAIDIQSSANVAEVAKARSEVSALGDAAKKSADLTRQAWEQAGGDLTKMAQIYARLTGQVQQSTVATDKNEAALQRQGMAMARAEQAAYRMNTTLEMQQRRMVQLHAEALRMNDAFDEMASVTGGAGSHGISHSAARGLGELGRGLGQVAQSGQLSAFSLREFTGAAFRLGAEIGPAGLGAAIGLSVLAIGTLVEAFGKSGEAAKKANQEFQSYLETLVHGSIVEASLARQRLFSGDPSALLTGPKEGESPIAFQARVGGQQYLEAEQARLQALVAPLNRATNQGTTATTQQKLLRDDYIKQLREITDLLNTSDSQLARVSGVYDELLGKAKDIEKFQLDQLRDKRDRRAVPTLPVDTSMGALANRSRAALTGTLSDISINPATLTFLDELKMKDLELQVQLTKTNLTFSRRLELQHQLADVQRQEDQYGTVDTSKIRGPRVAKLFETPWEQANLANLEQIGKLGKSVQTHLGNTLASSLAAGITAGFKGAGVKGAFAAAGETLLAGLGGIFIDLGKTYLEYSGIMEALTPLLGDPFTAGYAGAAIGAALIGLGAALEGVSQSHRSGASGGYAGNGGTFTPSQLANGGGVTLIVQTVNPFSREVVSATQYYINRGQMLSTPVPTPYGAPS